MDDSGRLDRCQARFPSETRGSRRRRPSIRSKWVGNGSLLRARSAPQTAETRSACKCAGEASEHSWGGQDRSPFREEQPFLFDLLEVGRDHTSAGNQHQPRTFPHFGEMATDHFPQPASRPVAFNGIPHAARCNDANTHGFGPRKNAQHKQPAMKGLSACSNFAKLGSPGQPHRLRIPEAQRRRGRLGLGMSGVGNLHAFRQKTLATTGAAARENRAPRLRLHAGAKTELTPTRPFRRLISAFHGKCRISRWKKSPNVSPLACLVNISPASHSPVVRNDPSFSFLSIPPVREPRTRKTGDREAMLAVVRGVVE